MRGGRKTRLRARINLRPLLFCALGIIFGVYLYARLRLFGGVRPSDFCFFALIFALALVPIGLKRSAAVLIAFLLFAGTGAALLHLYTERFLDAKEGGEYEIVGTVSSFTVMNGYSDVVMTGVTLDGRKVGGKLEAVVSTEEVRAGDILSFPASVTKNELPMSEGDYSVYLFCRDIRYHAYDKALPEKTGRSSNGLLLLGGILYDTLDAHLEKEEASVAYSLLTGNSHGMDRGLMEEVRRGGVAHIFAVSGLHIGILYGGVYFLCGRLRRKAFLPALACAFLYTVFCNFTVSSVRALIMCAVMGIRRATGRKYDFLSSLSLSAVIVLLLFPADFLSAGFRLSFGACAGLALFSGTLTRLMKRLKFPRFLAGYLSASLSVQLFTFPVLLTEFGYFSVWGFLLNFFLIPLLPVIFSAVLIFSLLSLVIPPAAGFFLAIPKGLLSLFLLLFSYGDFSLVLAGFSLGMGGLVWLVACVVLSERVRMGRVLRGAAAVGMALLFALSLVLENAVFSGGRIFVYSGDDGSCALVRSKNEAVLILGEVSLGEAEDFLLRRYSGTLDAVLVLSEDEQRAINVAAALSSGLVCAKDEIPTGLRETPLFFGDEISVGELYFRYESRDKLVLAAFGAVIEVDFTGRESLGADLFLGKGMGGLQFTVNRGIIKLL